MTSNPSGIDGCASPCDARFAPGTVVLHPRPRRRRGTSFAGWGGACSGTGSCSVTMSSDQAVDRRLYCTEPFPYPASAATPSTIAPGQGAKSTVTLTSVNGFNSSVNFTCSAQPSPAFAPTCSLNPCSSGASCQWLGELDADHQHHRAACGCDPVGCRHDLLCPMAACHRLGVGWNRSFPENRAKESFIRVLLYCDPRRISCYKKRAAAAVL